MNSTALLNLAGMTQNAFEATLACLLKLKTPHKLLTCQRATY